MLYILWHKCNSTNFNFVNNGGRVYRYIGKYTNINIYILLLIQYYLIHFFSHEHILNVLRLI